MENKNRVIVDKQEIKAMVIDGKEYMQEENETELEFAQRVDRELRVTGKTLKDFLASENIEKITLKKYNKEQKKLKSVSKASNSLQEKIEKTNEKAKKGITKKAVALGLTIALAVGAVGCGLAKKAEKAPKEPVETEEEQEVEYTENQELNKVLNEIAKEEDGEEIVERLLAYYDFQKSFNKRMTKDENKDKNGNAIYLKAEEIAAVDAIANGTNMDVPLTLPANLVICNYLEAGIMSTNAMYVTEEKTGFGKFIEDEETKKDYKKGSNAVAKVLDNENGANKNCRNIFKRLYKTPKTYPEVVSLLSYDGNLTTAGLEGAIDGQTVEKYQEKTKRNNAILNYVMNYIEQKEKLQDNNKIMKLSLEAYEIMNDENIKVDKKGREKFDASTTEKGLRVSRENETINATSEENVVTQEEKTTERKKVTKEEAEKEFGKDEVKKAEEKAREETYVDTDGDGKEDTQIDEANEKEEEKKEQLEQEARGYEDGYAQGQKDGREGKTKNSSCSGSSSYKKGYKNGYEAGYANGVKMKEAAEEEKIIEETEEYNEEPKKEDTKEKKEVEDKKEEEEKTQDDEEEYVLEETEERTYEDEEEYVLEETEERTYENGETKKVVTVERDGVVHETNPSNTVSKVKSVKTYETESENAIKIEMEDGTTYSSSYVRTRA